MTARDLLNFIFLKPGKSVTTFITEIKNISKRD